MSQVVRSGNFSSHRRGRLQTSRDRADYQLIQRLIWAYILLWVFEGVLRKWVVPSLSNVLLLVRDPVLLGIYFLAWRSNIFPRNGFVLSGAVLSFFLVVAGLVAPGGSIPIVLYGWRVCFLHFPLIWVMASVIDARQFHKICSVLLVASPVLAAIMVLQFVSPGTSWINSGAGEGASQLGAAMGKVRPSATFSFASGPVYFFSLITAILLDSQLSRRRYSPVLLVTATASILLAASVSGSRGLVASIGFVVACGVFAGLVLQPQLIVRWGGLVAAMAVIFFAVQEIPVVREGMEVFAKRVEQASHDEGGSEGFMERMGDGFVRAVPALYDVPLFGYGLGLGTNVGATLSSGGVGFTLGEDEWPRNISESGPILGIAFILWRVSLAFWLFCRGLMRAMSGDPLAFLLMGAVVLTLVTGNIGQPTALGFCIVTAGLGVTAIRLGDRGRSRGTQTNTGRSSSSSRQGHSNHGPEDPGPLKVPATAP